MLPVEALLVENRADRLIAALVRGGRLDDLVVVPTAPGVFAGSVVAGRVVRVRSGMEAAFVDIGTPAHALLRARDLPGSGPLARRLHEGQKLAVKVVHDGYDDKGPRVIGRVGAKEQAAALAAAVGSVVASPDPWDQVLAAVGAEAPGEIVVADTLARRRLVRAWTSRGRREPGVTLDDEGAPLGRFDALADIQAALDREVALAGGGRLTFDQARALMAVDVDSGAEARDLAACNRVAAAEIARQFRIRNSAGVIVIDFIESGTDDRTALDGVMRQAVRADRAGCRLAGFGPLGLYELTRRRAGRPLAAVWQWGAA